MLDEKGPYKTRVSTSDTDSGDEQFSTSFYIGLETHRPSRRVGVTSGHQKPYQLKGYFPASRFTPKNIRV
jgi:hypothetical protein